MQGVGDAGAGALAGDDELIFPTEKGTLDAHEDLPGNDGRMGVFHIVLREGALVFRPLFGEEVFGVGLLQQEVAHVFFVLQHGLDGGMVPFGLPGGCEDALVLQAGNDFAEGQAFQEVPEDSPDHVRLLGHDHQVAAFFLGVAQKPVVVQHRLSPLEVVLDAHPHVLGNGLALLLGEGGHDGDEQLAAGAHGVDILLFKEDGDVQRLELSDVLKAVQGISGETADGFGDDHVDFMRLAVLDHPVEVFPFFGGGAA